MGSGKGGSSWVSKNSSSKSLPECYEKKCHHPVAKFLSSQEYSIHCDKHACKFGAGCRDSKRSRAKFCAHHSMCAMPNCGTKVLDVEGGGFLYSNIGHKKWFCRDHSCKVKVKDRQCYEPRHENSQYCEEHSKEFQCKMPKCDSDRDGSERYCKKHHCEVDNCHRRILKLPDDEMDGRDKKRCYQHQRCEASRECKSYSLWDSKKIPTKLCANHFKCQFLHGCNGFAQGDSRFCTDHECDQSGCLQPRDAHNSLTMRWCHMHLCSAPGCPDFANGHGHAYPQKCFRHTCQRGDCAEIVQDSNPNSRFCQTHACADSACTNESTIPGGYCFAHACITPGCRAPQERGSPFPGLCTRHVEEIIEQQQQHYHHTATRSGTTSRSGSRTSSHDSRRIPRSFRHQHYHYPTYQAPVQASEADRRYESYDNLDDHYQRMPRSRWYD
ncbi:hypothetical protein FAGAP_9890 [Fusarium agapanthi]|uniref:Uncharacterized protein n=1 Tax=Fusarium agapanthi TaxID=1803897 RepID=A0A9P5EB17_9HYPO|nr:hypothetical protein FAGAP_9890 [Fusarium agapanthi]